jgi:hypothetical protein
MTLNKFALVTAGGFVAFAVILTISAPKLRAAVRATFVEVVLPSKPYNETITFSSSKSKTFGPDTGVLGISTITFTNFAAFEETITIRQAGVVNGDCSSGTLVSQVAPDTTFLLQPRSSMVIPYSSPLVFSGVGGHTCLFAQVPSNINGDTIQLGLTGFVN